ncbi:MAG: hypothetical protein RIS29_2598 [Bacteroidota bacterium]|jgi:AraC-like DNA-binding protein/ligand-binding sensor domain-containing protein
MKLSHCLELFNAFLFRTIIRTTFRKILTLILLALCLIDSKGMPQQYYAFNNIEGVTKKLCVRSIVQSADGMIWLAAESGLYSYDGYHLIKRPVEESDVDRIDTGSFNCLLADGDSLLIGSNKGVLSFNLKTYTFRLLPYADDEIIKDITRTASTLWVATGNAIYRNGRKLEPCPDNIVSLYRDETCLYIGTDNAVYSYSLTNNQLEKIDGSISYVTCFISDKQHDLLWVGTASNITAWSNQAGKKLFSIPIPVAKSICADMWGNMLVGTDNGLYIVGKDQQARVVRHDARRENSLAGDAVWSIFKDRSNNIWIGTNSGVSILPGNGLMTTYYLPAITGEGTGNQFFCTYSDSKGRKWLGGANGLLCIEQLGRENQTFRWYRMNDARYPIPHNRIRDIVEDSQGNIYVGGDMGLMQYDEASQQFKRYVIEEDPFNWVYAVRESVNKELVITTYTATYIATLDKFSHRIIVKKTIQRESLSAKSNKEKALLEKYSLSEDNLSVFYDSRNGTLLLGGTDRFSVLNIKKLNEVRMKKVLAITDIRINNERYIEHKDILKGEVMLLPEDRIIEVMFSDFHYSGELSHNYLYRIDNGGWVPVHSSGNSFLLSNLSPGTHKLHIRFSDTTEDAIAFDLTVRAPWYATTLAKVIYLLLLLFLMYGILLIIRQRKLIRAEQLAKQSFLLKAQQKEKELLNENEYLTAQLRLQLQAKLGEDGVLSENERFLIKITKIIEDNLSDSDLNVDTLCEFSGISSKQLYRRIKAMTGMTTVAYIRNQRLKKAATLLAKGTFNVSEVMYMVGFSNPSYFTRCFTEEYKTAPSEWHNRPKEL